MMNDRGRDSNGNGSSRTPSGGDITETMLGPDLRVPLHIVADLVFSLETDTDVVSLSGVTTDLSESGMRVTLAGTVPAGTLLSIRLHLPDDQAYVCGGRVVRTGTLEVPGNAPSRWVAVEFANVSTELRGSLRRCLWDVQRDLRLRRA
jgi:c-di-GMP-binding flagellar brake protein YcgR